MQLKRDISILNLMFIGISSIVGSGWLFGAFYAAQIAGPAAIISWIIGFFCIAVIALVYSELATMLPFNGGFIVYLLLSHGKMTSAVLSWITWLALMVVVPIEVQAVIQYSSHYIPNVIHEVNGAGVLTGKGFLIAAFLVFILTFINVVGVKNMANTNRFIVIWKLIIPFVAAILLLTVNTHTENLTAVGGFAPFGFEGILTAVAVGGISFSFMGFQNIIFLAGEARNPQKAIPIALFGSLFACLILYLMLQIGFLLSLNPSSLSEGWKTIHFVGNEGPFAGIFLALGMIFMANVLYFDAILSPMGAGISYAAAASRVLYSMSLQKDVPKVLSKLNRFSIPWIAVLVNSCIGMLLFLPFSGWQAMVALQASALVIVLSCGPICIPLFRKRFSHLNRPFKLPYSTAISFFAFYICNLMLQWTGWNTIWKLDVGIGIGIVLFSCAHFFNRKSQSSKLHIKSFTWFALFLIFSGIISYLGTFGGGRGIISMEMDFIVIAVSSLIVFVTAQKTAVTPTDTNDFYTEISRKNAA